MKKEERRNEFNSKRETFWSRNRSPWLCSKQKPDRCEPQDTLRCAKAVLEVRGEISWLPGAPELEPVAQNNCFRREMGPRGSVRAETRTKWMLRARRVRWDPSQSPKGPDLSQHFL